MDQTAVKLIRNSERMAGNTISVKNLYNAIDHRYDYNYGGPSEIDRHCDACIYMLDFEGEDLTLNHIKNISSIMSGKNNNYHKNKIGFCEKLIDLQDSLDNARLADVFKYCDYVHASLYFIKPFKQHNGKIVRLVYNALRLSVGLEINPLFYHKNKYLSYLKEQKYAITKNIPELVDEKEIQATTSSDLD